MPFVNYSGQISLAPGGLSLSQLWVKFSHQFDTLMCDLILDGVQFLPGIGPFALTG
jgi:hypothetical protein